MFRVVQFLFLHLLFLLLILIHIIQHPLMDLLFFLRCMITSGHFCSSHPFFSFSSLLLQSVNKKRTVWFFFCFYFSLFFLCFFFLFCFLFYTFSFVLWVFWWDFFLFCFLFLFRQQQLLLLHHWKRFLHRFLHLLSLFQGLAIWTSLVSWPWQDFSSCEVLLPWREPF